MTTTPTPELPRPSSDPSSFLEWLCVMAQSMGKQVVEKALLVLQTLFDSATPRWARLTLLGALAYLLLPTDAVPDVLPAVGFVDDLGILLTAANAVRKSIRVKHLRFARRQMSDWGLEVNTVPEHWDDDQLLYGVDPSSFKQQ